MKIEVEIKREVEISRSVRVMQVEGMFDVPARDRSEQVWRHCVDFGNDWNVGVIVGPSGSGKTTFAREAFGSLNGGDWEWATDRSILDGFPSSMGIREITGLLSSVGFSSPPSWLRPFGALSTGEQFRVNMARTLAEAGVDKIAVVDEFSSTVDRTVAKIASAAVGKAVRRRGGKFVAVTCHYDVLDWLEPDWVYEPHTGKLTTNSEGLEPRGRLWRRPGIELVVRRVHPSAWELFKRHHYLDGDIHKSATCFVGFVKDGEVLHASTHGGLREERLESPTASVCVKGLSTREAGCLDRKDSASKIPATCVSSANDGGAEVPAVFTAVLFFPHASSPGWREHRTVCLPDFQGVGIGNGMSEFVASMFAAKGRPYRSTTSHPGMIEHRWRAQGDWRMVRKPSTRSAHGGLPGRKGSVGRVTAGFRYVGEARKEDAEGFGILKGQSGHSW